MDAIPVATSSVIAERLADPALRQVLADIFRRYYEDLLPILSVATAESDGVRPDGLANEVYACFHHMARAVCLQESDPESELRSANKTHLKRAILDSYKIAVHAYLVDESQAKELLDYMVLVKEFGDYLPHAIGMAAEIKALSKQVRQAYRRARMCEMAGDFDRAISGFNETLDLCEDMRGKLEVFTGDRTYVLACEREARRKRERDEDRRIGIWVPIVCCIVTALLTAAASRYFIPNRAAPHEGATKEDAPVAATTR